MIGFQLNINGSLFETLAGLHERIKEEGPDAPQVISADDGDGNTVHLATYSAGQIYRTLLEGLLEAAARP